MILKMNIKGSFLLLTIILIVRINFNDSLVIRENKSSPSKDNSFENSSARTEGFKSERDISKKANMILNNIQIAILNKEKKIFRADIIDGSQISEPKNRPEEQKEFYQGDIVLTRDQAMDLIKGAVEEAKEKDVDISDIDINL